MTDGAVLQQQLHKWRAGATFDHVPCLAVCPAVLLCRCCLTSLSFMSLLSHTTKGPSSSTTRGARTSCGAAPPPPAGATPAAAAGRCCGCAGFRYEIVRLAEQVGHLQAHTANSPPTVSTCGRHSCCTCNVEWGCHTHCVAVQYVKVSRLMFAKWLAVTCALREETHFLSWLSASRMHRLQKRWPHGPATGSSGASRHSPHSAPEQSALSTDSAGPAAAAAACAAAWAAKSRTTRDLSDSLQQIVGRYDSSVVRHRQHSACQHTTCQWLAYRQHVQTPLLQR